MSSDYPIKQFSGCLEHLRKFYTKSKVKITPWNPEYTEDIDEIDIQLSMLIDDRKPYEETKEKLQDYAEIFNGYGRHLNPKRILVYGKPGIGKSTFAQKIAVDWARGKKEILKRFDVLLLMKLRDVCDSDDFCTMLETAELLPPDDAMAVDKLDKYVRQYPDKVLLVLDGYDEYNGGKPSPVHQIWRGKILKGCCVVMTTLQDNEDELSKPSHVQFELNGLDSEKQVKQFSGKFLSDQKDVEELVEYLRKHDLWDMAKIPLLLLMLCLVWKENDRKGLPKPGVDLYSRFLQILLDHLVAKDLVDTPQNRDKNREKLSKLEELAFDALLEGFLYLNLSEGADGLDFNKLVDIGFLHTSKPTSWSCEEIIVHFLHKPIQAFLAAQFIVRELTRKENKTSACLSIVDSLETAKELAEILKFVCELSADGARAVFKHLQWIGEKEGLTEFNFAESPHRNDFSFELVSFISICTDCLICCATSDRQILLPLFLECVHDVVILQPEQLPIAAREHLLRSTSGFAPQFVFFDYLNEDTKVMDDEIFSVMCDLNTAVVTSSGEVRKVKQYASLEMMNVFLKKEGEHMLLCLNTINKDRFNALPTELLTELSSTPVFPPQKSVDDLSKNQDNLLRQTGQHCLSFVGKITMQFATSEDITVVNNVLSSITRPKKIKIASNSSTSTFCEAGLISNIQFTDCLHSLKLIDIRLTAKCATQIAESLHQVPNLQKLDLSCNPLYSSVCDFAKNIHHLPGLTQLKLTDVQMGEKECIVLASSLNNVSKLQVLEIGGNPLGHGIIALAKHLIYLPELVALTLEDAEMGENEAIAVARCLPNLLKLKKIRLSGNPLGHGIIELAEHLNCLPGLTELGMAQTNMGEEEAAAIVRCLPSLSQLKILNLSVNPLGHGIIQLAERLKCVPNLTDLLLYNTHMDKKQVSALARALKHVPKLRELYLYNNPLGRGVRVLIQHVSNVPELRKLFLRGVKMTKKEVNDLGAVRNVKSDYHVSVSLFRLIISNTSLSTWWCSNAYCFFRLISLSSC